MAFDKQLEDKFKRIQKRILELEKAAEAHDRVCRQLADILGVEVDLTRMPTPGEVFAAEQSSKSTKSLLRDPEIQAFLDESKQEDAE
ncbi:MAG: hypothetical protein ACYC99_14925 [Candidatus Geothermincolia bacterium]